MEIYIAGNYKEMSRQASAAVAQLMQSREEPLICTASGDSPAGLYNEIASLVKGGKLDTSNWNFVALDEWVGLNGNDEGSCRYHLDKQLFHPLHARANQICFFNGRSADLQKECEEVENFIGKHNGIDVAIVGLGLNGHIGMNEPGTPATLGSHIADLDPLTQKVGQKYFKEAQPLTQGITLGLASILKSRHIILVVSGGHKAEIVKRILEDEPSEQLPGTLLRSHPGLKIYLETEAASLINPG